MTVELRAQTFLATCHLHPTNRIRRGYVAVRLGAELVATMDGAEVIAMTLVLQNAIVRSVCDLHAAYWVACDQARVHGRLLTRLERLSVSSN